MVFTLSIELQIRPLPYSSLLIVTGVDVKGSVPKKPSICEVLLGDGGTHQVAWQPWEERIR